MSAPTVLDLFCGAAGGWSLGMHRAGFETVAACEVDPWRRAVFAQNFPNARMFDDIRGLTASRLVSEIGALPDVIVGSPPCQDASAANTKGKGVDGERTGLFFEALRIVGECRPRWVAFENVPRLRTRGADRVLGALEEIGYAAWPLVVGARHVGANHPRDRVWIVAFDAARLGHERGWAWRHRPHGDGSAYPARSDAADASGFGWANGWRWNGRRLDVPAQEGAGGAEEGFAPGQSRGAGLELGQSLPEDHEPQRQAAERAAYGRGDGVNADREGQSHGSVEAEMGRGARAGEDAGEPWADWNGGLARHLRLDDGLSARLAAAAGDRKHPLCGVAGEIVSAYGDAVLPQIPEMIGRSILRVDAALSIVTGGFA